MKIGIVTFHRASNYGAVLQAYALTRYINNKGHECRVIDYRSDYMEKYYSAMHIKGKSFKQMIGVIVNAPIRIARKRKFECFRKKYLPITNTVYTKQTIQETNYLFDRFVFGSDQIWNPMLSGGDDNFFGAFVLKNEKLCSYASSFGGTKLDDEKEKMYKELLKRFNCVGIREKSGAEMYTNLTSKNAEEVVDPVILLEAQEWAALARKKKKSRYIYVYHLLGKKTDIMGVANYLSEKTGYPIIDGQAWARKYPQGVTPQYNNDPRDFLGWIQNAEYVVTDSFHCTAFSIIFEKKFWARIDTKFDVEETRVGNLLLNLGLENRIVPDLITEWNFMTDINYVDSRYKLLKLKEKSYTFLEKILESKL